MYKEILDEAINLIEEDNSYNLFDAITTIIEEKYGNTEFDFIDFAEYIKKNKAAINCLRNDIIKKKLYKNINEQLSINLEDYF